MIWVSSPTAMILSIFGTRMNVTRRRQDQRILSIFDSLKEVEHKAIVISLYTMSKDIVQVHLLCTI